MALHLSGLHAAIAAVEREAGRVGEAAAEEEKERGLGRLDCARAPLECDFAAVAALRKLESLPPSVPRHEWRAGQLRDEGRFAESAEEWRQAVALSPRDARLRTELAVTLRLNHDLAGAQAVLEEVLREQPQAALASYLLGDVLLARQQPEAAIPPLETALRLDPGLAHAEGALGRAYALVGRAVEAVPHLEKALPIDEDGSLRLQLARAYRAAGRGADADRTLAEWERLRKLTPP